MKEVIIPFSGFYETTHQLILDDELEQHNEYCNEEGDVENCYPEDLNWNKIHTEYAKKYTENFFDSIKEENDGLQLDYKFLQVESPEYYNFSNDIIVVEMSDEDIVKLYDYINNTGNQHTLEHIVREELTPCDGFSPFYSNDVWEWGDVLTWQPVQLRFLFDSIAYEGDVYELMENDRCNGGITECLDSGINENA